MSKKFDRYEILTNHYRKEILGWSWHMVEKEAKGNCQLDEEDQIIGQCFLGSVFSLMPSGKYYMPWCSNQTRNDEIKDSCYMEALESVASEHGMYITSGEGDACDLFAGKSFEIEDDITFITEEDYERAMELFDEYQSEVEEESLVS